MFFFYFFFLLSFFFFFAYKTDFFDPIVLVVTILKMRLIRITKLITKSKRVLIIVMKTFVFMKLSIDEKDLDLMNFVERQYE